MTKVCKACSGTGGTPDVVEAYDRIIAAACDAEELWGHVIAENGVSWADVLALAREWRRLAPLDRTPSPDERRQTCRHCGGFIPCGC